MYNIDSLRIFSNLYGVRPSVCYAGYVIYTIYGGTQVVIHLKEDYVTVIILA